MAIAAGFSKTVTDGLILGYDTADLVNSFRGQPTINRFLLPGGYGPGAASDNNVGFQVQGTGTFVRLGWGQMVGDYLIQPGDVVYKYTLGSNGCHYHGNDVAIPGGSYATFTVDYFITPDTAGFENSTLAVFEIALGGSVNVDFSQIGVWKTATFTSGPTGGGNLRMLLYPGGCGPRMASSGTLFMKNPRVEYRPYSTAFVDGERTATRSILDLKNSFTFDVSNASFISPGDMVFDGINDSITAACSGVVHCLEMVWYNNNAIPDNESVIGGPSTYQTPISFNGTANGVHLGAWTGGLSNEAIHIWNGGGATATKTGRPVGFHHALFNWNGSSYDIWIDGDQEITFSLSGTTHATLLTSTTGIRVAGDPNNYFFNGKIPVVKLYNRSLTTTEILQNFSTYNARYKIAETFRYFEGTNATPFVQYWNNSTTFTMADFGGISNVTAHGWTNGPATYTLTLNSLPPHAQVRYKVFWHLVDSLDNETSNLFIGDGSSEIEILRFTKIYNAAPNISVQNAKTSAIWSGHKNYSYRPWGNGVYGADGYLSIDSGWIGFSSSTFTARHVMGADQVQADEAMYLSHVELLVRY